MSIIVQLKPLSKCATTFSDALPKGVLFLQRNCASPIVPGTLHS